jgi:hypothetical protein
MQKVRRFLLDPRPPLWRYCLLAFPLALVPSLTLAILAFTVAVAFGVDTAHLQPPHRDATINTALNLIVFAPVIETLLLAGGIYILKKCITKSIAIAFVSALAWGSLHATVTLILFFGTVWSFFVFSCAYLAWRKWGFGRAYIAAAVPHALINLTAFGVIVLSDIVD